MCVFVIQFKSLFVIMINIKSEGVLANPKLLISGASHGKRKKIKIVFNSTLHRVASFNLILSAFWRWCPSQFNFPFAQGMHVVRANNSCFWYVWWVSITTNLSPTILHCWIWIYSKFGYFLERSNKHCCGWQTTSDQFFSLHPELIKADATAIKLLKEKVSHA